MAQVLIIADDADGGRGIIELMSGLVAVPAQIRGQVLEEVRRIGMIDIFPGSGQRFLYIDMHAAEIGCQIGEQALHVFDLAVIPVLLYEWMIAEVYISQALIAFRVYYYDGHALRSGLLQRCPQPGGLICSDHLYEYEVV